MTDNVNEYNLQREYEAREASATLDGALRSLGAKYKSKAIIARRNQRRGKSEK